MPTLKLAFDKSARHIDEDGRLHIAKSHISKAVVNPYYGSEIPGYQELGLDPQKIYNLLRDPEELEKSAPTFARLPILKKHIPVTVDTPQPDLVIGAIGSDVEFSNPYLDADLCFWDAEAIAGIETGKMKELSCAYRYDPMMEPGEFEGTHYDGRMTNIRGNHLALVEVGRAGSDVVVADQKPQFFKERSMRMTKLGKALFAALSAASPVLAADSALPALVGSANRKNFNPKDVKAKLLALDAELDPEQLDNVIDALLDVEQDPKPQETPAAVGDESPAEKIKSLLDGKVDESVIEQIVALCAAPAEDEKPEKKPGEEKEPGMKPEEVKAAMDGLRKELRAAAEAAREVRPVVGDVTMDSAAEIYGFALDQMKVDRTGIDSVAALKALYKVASAAKSAAAPVVAQDAAGLAKQFSGVNRFHPM